MVATTATDNVLDVIEEEHRELDALYAGIRSSLADRDCSLHSMQGLFESLAERVRNHFECEEREGYFDEIILIAPRLSSRAQRLEREHAELLELADELAKDIRHAQESSIWRFAIRVDFEHFIHRCEDHEAAENGLVQEAYLQDIGAQD